MPRRKRKSRCRSDEAPRTARRWEIKGSSARTAHRMLTLTFTSVGHPECVLGTVKWRLRRAQTRRVGPLFRRGGSPELRASSLVGSWGTHRPSTRWNMSTDNRLADLPEIGIRQALARRSGAFRSGEPPTIPPCQGDGSARTAHRSRARTLTCQSFHERELSPRPHRWARRGDMVAKV